jgi:hypothetical protein
MPFVKTAIGFKLSDNRYANNTIEPNARNTMMSEPSTQAAQDYQLNKLSKLSHTQEIYHKF